MKTLTHNAKVLNKVKMQRDLSLCFAFLLLVGIFGTWYENNKFISPCPTEGCFVKTVYASGETTELQQITDYIVYKFQPYGHDVAVKALKCFISESGLRPEAYNYNSNNTWDYGLAQWNQVHGQTIDQLKDWHKQIDLAENLYKRQGWKPWYGEGCR